VIDYRYCVFEIVLVVVLVLVIEKRKFVKRYSIGYRDENEYDFYDDLNRLDNSNAIAHEPESSQVPRTSRGTRS
jgi:hypothetical protein